MVGHALRGLHRGDVGVDEDGGDALLSERLERLAAAVVKLAGFAYLQCARAEEQHFLYLFFLHNAEFWVIKF